MSQDRPGALAQDRPGAVIHVRENSDTELEALFNISILGPETNNSVPLRLRNLPASFFCPPDPQKQGVITHLRTRSSPTSFTSAPPPPTSHVRQHSYDALDEQPLPAGWDIARTPEGQRYFVNHVLQITTWDDPRKSHNKKNTGPATNPSNTNNSSTSDVTMNRPQKAEAASASFPLSSSGVVNIEEIPLPAGWEKAYTSDWEVYFINHVDRTTSWFHPLIPSHLQKPGMKSQQPQQQLTNTDQEQLKHLKIQQLQLEQERLKKMQDEIARQEMALRSQVDGRVRAAGFQQQSSDVTPAGDHFMVRAATSDNHSRQESGDSGLGGMSTSYSLPRTPEFLGNMEDMDTQDGGIHSPTGPDQADFGSIDIANLGDIADQLTLDSDDLVPSLQEEINSELLQDVETVLRMRSKEDTLTWL